jgi:hypothetical protein
LEKFLIPHEIVGVPQDLAKRLYRAIRDCTVLKGYRGVDVPNVNLNLEMDLLVEIDNWFISHVQQGHKVDSLDFLKAKSNSFFVLDIPKAANYSQIAYGIKPAGKNSESSG